MSDQLARVRRAARARARADVEYRAAIVAAYESLRDDHPAPFATVAEAAGVQRQSVRELVERARITHDERTTP